MKQLFTILLACLLAGALLAMGITQEVAIGGLEGRVTMRENGLPLGHALVVVTPLVRDDFTETKNWHVRSKADGSFVIPELPAGDYKVAVDGEEHSVVDKSISIPEGRRTDIEARLEPNEPSLTVESGSQVIAPGVSTQLNASGYVAKDAITVSIYRLKLDQVAAKGGVNEALQPVNNYQDLGDPSKAGALITSFDHRIVSKDAEGAFAEHINLPKLPEGLYFVLSKAAHLHQAVFLNVTKIALVTESTSKQSLCFVTDIDSGKPLSNVAIFVASDSGLRQVAMTDFRGLATVDAGKLAAVRGSDGAAMLIARQGDSVGACGFRQESANEDGDTPDPSIKIFTYADRPIYRPGDTVQFKAIVRKLVGNDLTLPRQGMAKVSILDAQNNLLETQSLPTSAHGTLHGVFKSSPEAPPGVYQIEIRADGGKESYYANLAAYRKPDYSIKVTPRKDRYSRGDTVYANVDCQYFFGGPVVGAKVSVMVMRHPAWDSEVQDLNADSTDDEDASSDADDYTGGQYVTELDALTDGTGRAVISFPADVKSENETSAEGDTDDYFDYRYSLEASVSETAGKAYEGSGSVLVTRGEYRINAETDPYILTLGQKANLKIQALSFDKTPVPASNQELKVEIGSVSWVLTEDGPDKRYTEVLEPTQTLSVRTDKSGAAVVPLQIGKAENLRIRVSGQDERGRTIKTETDAFVEGSSAFGEQAAAKLAVRLDKKTYNVGDTAKVLIATGTPGGTALLTVQAEGIMQTRMVLLDKGTSIVNIPVSREMSPNVWVHVAYVHSRGFEETSRRLKVARPDKILSVQVIPQSPKALPGSTVTFTVKTSDQAGRGVPADVSLGVVDESIYTIRKDDTDIKRSLFPERGDEVQVAYSFPPVFLDGGDKGGGAIKIRRKFEDTASWNPDVQTDQTGTASIQVKLPDNLTSWRATAVAATDESSVGMSTANVVASRPVMVRLITPQFLVVSDRQQASAAITNDSGKPLDLDFKLHPMGIGLSGDLTQRVHVNNGQTVELPLDLNAEASGTASLIALAKDDGGLGDAVEGKIPILPHGRLVIKRQSGTIHRSTEVALNLLPSHDPDSGELHLTVTPGLASAMLQSIDQLVLYPYGCVEQTMSRFLPALQVTHAISGTPLRRPDLEKKAAGIAKDGFERLLKMQHGDGAWGWWVYDASDPFMTAWVLDGLKRADDIGYSAPASLNTSLALKWSVARLNKPFKDDTQAARLFLIYAIAEYGMKHEAATALAHSNLSKAGSGELALAALAASAIGDKESEAEALSRLHRSLSQGAVLHDTDRIWSDNEGAALSLLALSQLDSRSSEIDWLVKSLMDLRSPDGWESTRETALVITSLCNCLHARPESTEPSTVALSLNGALVKTIKVDPAAADVPDYRLAIPINQLQAGINKMVLTADKGQPYFSVDLTQYDVQPTLGQVLQETGVDVVRRYFKMEPRVQENGEMKLLPSLTPVSLVHSGDVIRCEITVHCGQPIPFLMVEDPIPSNCTVTDRQDPDEDETWSFWWSSLVIRDDRVSLFAREAPKGNQVLTYTMRAEGSGLSHAMPTTVEDMYAPEINASGGESLLEVRP